LRALTSQIRRNKVLFFASQPKKSASFPEFFLNAPKLFLVCLRPFLTPLKFRKEIILGVVVLLTAAASIWGINFLKGNDVFTKELVFNVVYDRVDGLVETSPVFLNGLKVGQVKEIALAPDNTGRILVKVMLFDRNLQVPYNSIFKLTSNSVLEPKNLQLVLGDVKSGKFLKSEDEVVGIYEQGLMEKFDPLEKKVEAVIDNVNKILDGVKTILDPKVQEGLKRTLENLDKTMTNLEKTSETLDVTMVDANLRLKKILSNVENLTTTLDNSKGKITNLLDNLSSVSDSLKAAHLKTTINNASAAIDQLNATLTQINSGQGTLGKLLKDEKLYNDLDKLALDLDTLLNDVKDHPSRYVKISVFGGKNEEGHKLQLNDK
jgi:phospholipid/cholesterol/gamma-HCH transport system substrate-binding protein